MNTIDDNVDPSILDDPAKAEPPANEPPEPKKDETLDIQEIAERLANEKVAGFKAKVDAAYVERDKVKQEMAALQAEYEAAQEASKQKESEQLRTVKEDLNNIKAENELLKQKLIIQDKNKAVSDALVGLPFVNTFAKNQAEIYLRENIRKNDLGTYEHTSGVNLRQYVEDVLVRDKEKGFWFKSRDNLGPDSLRSPAAGPSPSGEVSLLDKDGRPKFTSQQMLELANKL